MKIKILQKYFFLATGTLIAFIILGFVFTGFVSGLLRTKKSGIPPLFIAKMIDQLDVNDRPNAIKLYEQLPDKDQASRVTLYDQDGRVVISEHDFPMPPLSPEFRHRFQKPFDMLTHTPDDRRRPPPPKPPFMLFGGHGPGPMPPENRIVRLSGTPVYYVGVMPGPMFNHDGPERYLPLIGPLSLLVSLLLGIAVALSLIYASVRKKVSEADHVISEIQSGNLKARFKVERRDEFGEAMLRFNKMADEIESLVEHLRFVESARNKILQELAHDLRTPVASLKNLLETMDSQSENLKPELKKELSQLSLREVDYFEQLVEDLLLLAQVDEPKYRTENQPVILSEVIDEVLNDCLSRPLYKNKKIAVEKNYSVDEARIPGSSNLIYRMFRNAFENSLSFAGAQIKVKIERVENNRLRIRIEDDGPGLSDEQISHYGERKLSRHISANEKGARLSVGLGSVIIKKICEIHRGRLQIRNIRNAEDRITGASLTLEFDEVRA